MPARVARLATRSPTPLRSRLSRWRQVALTQLLVPAQLVAVGGAGVTRGPRALAATAVSLARKPPREVNRLTRRTRSQSDKSPERQSKMLCYAFSRGSQNCKGPKDGCYKQHKPDNAMTAKERLDRDKYEEKRLREGKPLGYSRSAKQANAAAANVQSTGRSPSKGSGKGRSQSPGSQKGKGKGKKGKNKTCNAFTETGKCSRGADCWFAKTTPGHP